MNGWRAGASTGGTGDVTLEARSAQSFVYRTAEDWDGFSGEGVAGASDEGFGPEPEAAAFAATVLPSPSQGSIPTQGVWAAQISPVAAPATTAIITHALPSIPTAVTNEPEQTWLEPPGAMGDGRQWDFEIPDLNATQMHPDQVGNFDSVPIPLFASLQSFDGTAGDARPDHAGLPQRLDYTPFTEEPPSSLDQLYWNSR